MHGSIIAREYDVPCVIGIPQATSLIHTGDLVTVDGYLALLLLDEAAFCVPRMSPYTISGRKGP